MNMRPGKEVDFIRRAYFVNSKNQHPNITNVRSSGLYTHVPTIYCVNKSDIKARFNMQHLTSIDCKPTFAMMQTLKEEFTSSALTANVRLGEGEGRKDASG